MRSAYNEKGYELTDICSLLTKVRFIMPHNFGQNAIVGASSIMPA